MNATGFSGNTTPDMQWPKLRIDKRFSTPDPTRRRKDDFRRFISLFTLTRVSATAF
jgi:hypothetical protein